MPLPDNAENRARAEAFIDRLDAKMHLIGSIDDYFCETQRLRRRQNIIGAFLGDAPEGEDFPQETSGPDTER